MSGVCLFSTIRFKKNPSVRKMTWSAGILIKPSIDPSRASICWTICTTETTLETTYKNDGKSNGFIKTSSQRRHWKIAHEGGWGTEQSQSYVTLCRCTISVFKHQAKGQYVCFKEQALYTHSFTPKHESISFCLILNSALLSFTLWNQTELTINLAGDSMK